MSRKFGGLMNNSLTVKRICIPISRDERKLLRYLLSTHMKELQKPPNNYIIFL